MIQQCFNLLNRSDKIKLLSIVGIQVALVSLDLIGVLLIGAVASVGVSAIKGEALTDWLQTLLNSIGLNDQTPQSIAAILGVSAGIALILKSVLTFQLNLRVLGFLARREALISAKLAEKIFASPLIELSRYQTSEIQYVLTAGANFSTVGVLGQSANLLAELFLQVAMLFTLFLYSPGLMFVTLCFFGMIFFILNFSLGKKASVYGLELASLSMNLNRAISDAVASYREIQVTNRRHFFLSRIVNAKTSLAEKSIGQSMLSQISKYVFETSIVIAGLFISGFAFLSRNAISAAELVTIFVAASSRIAPSVMKIQVGWIALKGAIGGTFKFFEMFLRLDKSTSRIMESNALLQTYFDSNDDLRIKLEDVDFHYPDSLDRKVIERASLKIPANGLVALVGPSGAGKSTLVDLMLGIHVPTAGTILLNQFAIQSKENDSIFGYVPQDVFLTSGSILENICFGIEPEDWDLDKAKRCLEVVGLNYLINAEGVISNKILGERGSGLSGGQRQRIGIARAIYSDPVVLVLDEATSSLDAESEYLISKAIDSIAEKATVIVIAHRLSTVRRAKQISYLDHGKIIATDTFDKLRETIPDFDRQANLMGITK